MTLVSYVPKKSRSVILVSSMHHDSEIDGNTQKPEIIMFYNLTKGGVDSMDFKISRYSSNRRTRRWPMVIFYNFLNISCANAYILKKLYPKCPKNLLRYDFMKEIAKSLVTDHMRNRLTIKNLPKEIALGIQRLLNIRHESDNSRGSGKRAKENILDSKATCHYCPPRIKRKTRFCCSHCDVPICLECTKLIFKTYLQLQIF